MKATSSISFVLLLILLVAGAGAGHRPSGEDSTALWIWSGVNLPSDTGDRVLYIYQGCFSAPDSPRGFHLRGLYPCATGAPGIHLVFRFREPLWHPAVAETMGELVRRWEAKGNRVLGIQVDCDCPTARLFAYAGFLEHLRAAVPARYALTATGLVDWLASGDPDDLRALSLHVDAIVFQLYRGLEPLPDLTRHAVRFERAAVPYSLGILTGQKLDTPRLREMTANHNYRGTITFLQPMVREDL